MTKSSRNRRKERRESKSYFENIIGEIDCPDITKEEFDILARNMVKEVTNSTIVYFYRNES